MLDPENWSINNCSSLARSWPFILYSERILMISSHSGKACPVSKYSEDFCSVVKQMDHCMSRITGHMSWQKPYFVRFFCAFTLLALDSKN